MIKTRRVETQDNALIVISRVARLVWDVRIVISRAVEPRALRALIVTSRAGSEALEVLAIPLVWVDALIVISKAVSEALAAQARAELRRPAVAVVRAAPGM